MLIFLPHFQSCDYKATWGGPQTDNPPVQTAQPGPAHNKPLRQWPHLRGSTLFPPLHSTFHVGNPANHFTNCVHNACCPCLGARFSSIDRKCTNALNCPAEHEVWLRGTVVKRTSPPAVTELHTASVWRSGLFPLLSQRDRRRRLLLFLSSGGSNVVFSVFVSTFCRRQLQTNMAVRLCDVASLLRSGSWAAEPWTGVSGSPPPEYAQARRLRAIPIISLAVTGHPHNGTNTVFLASYF